MEQMQSKINSLAASLRVTQGVLLISLAVNFLIVATAAQQVKPEPQREIIAGKFILQGKDGKPAAVLETDEGKVALSFLDSKQRQRLAIGVREDMPWTTYFDTKGKNRLSIGIGMEDDEQPQIIFSDENEKHRLVFRLEPHPTLWMLNNKMEKQVYLAADKETRFQLLDAQGKVRLTSGTSTDQSFLQLFTADHQPRVNLTAGPDRGIAGFYTQPASIGLYLGVMPDQESGLFLYDSDEVLRAKLSRPANKQPQLKLIDNAGKMIFEK